ncbi:hypothetical protein [Jeotgalibacillus aurantiacus]|nr:hypothetical protein [Jeotgalibacillus aurantiacus]
MDWLWAWLAFSLAAGAFYEAHQVKKENKILKDRIENLENKVFE